MFPAGLYCVLIAWHDDQSTAVSLQRVCLPSTLLSAAIAFHTAEAWFKQLAVPSVFLSVDLAHATPANLVASLSEPN